MIGYREESGSRVYQVYDEDTKQVLLTRDIVFDETGQELTPHTVPGTTAEQEPDKLSAGTNEQDRQIEYEASWERGKTPSEEEDEESPGETLPPIDPDEVNTAPHAYDKDTIVVRQLPVQVLPTTPETTTTYESRRLRPRLTTKEIFRPAAGQAYMAVAEEPVSLQEALAGENRREWKAAWESEVESLQKNGTWVVAKSPPERNIVGCRWLFVRKGDGRFKVRLVAKGFSQKPGIDFTETFALVAKFTTLRVQLALVAENDWELHTMDVKTAFLNGVLEEEIYMECPEGLEEKIPQGMVCRLVKAIYGLRQSPRTWYQKIHEFFLAHGFIRSTQDYSLYVNYERRVLVLVYVDDLVLAAAEVEQIEWIKAALTNTFEMGDLGELTTYLGLDISRNRNQWLLTLDQTKYIDKILNRHRMQDARPSLTPLDPNTRLVSNSKVTRADPESQLLDFEVYQSAMGSLMYAMLGTRPDIAYAVGLISQFNHSPEPEHWVAVKRIFRYLVGTRELKIQYGSSNESGTYSDADWGSGQDRKSVGGFVFLLNGGAVSWASKKQTSIALSTTEGEYMAMTQASKEIIWLQELFQELGALAHIDQISRLYGDNQGALALACNPEYHARTKHIDIQYHFVRELVMGKKIYLEYCPTTDMIADIMTKALPRTTHEKHSTAMGMIGRVAKHHGTLREGAC